MGLKALLMANALVFAETALLDRTVIFLNSLARLRMRLTVEFTVEDVPWMGLAYANATQDGQENFARILRVLCAAKKKSVMM